MWAWVAIGSKGGLIGTRYAEAPHWYITADTRAPSWRQR